MYLRRADVEASDVIPHPCVPDQRRIAVTAASTAFVHEQSTVDSLMSMK